MDITFPTEKGRFNYRVAGLLIHDNRLLVIREEHSPYAYLPGGRVQFGETLESAIRREIKEELGHDSEIIRPLWLAQSFFNEDESQEHFHELCLYFLMEVPEISLEDFSVVENARLNQFEWVAFEKLENLYFYPNFLKKAIWNLPEELTMILT